MDMKKFFRHHFLIFISNGVDMKFTKSLHHFMGFYKITLFNSAIYTLITLFSFATLGLNFLISFNYALGLQKRHRQRLLNEEDKLKDSLLLKYINIRSIYD